MSTSESTQSPVTRRKVLAGGSALIIPSIATVATGTESGYVEIDVDVDVPNGTSVNVHAFEDLTADGSADNDQSVSLVDGSGTYQYTTLDGWQDQGIDYWFEIELESNEDQDETPEVHSLEIRLPEDEPEDDDDDEPEPEDEPEGIFELWDNFLVWVALSVFAAAAMAMASKSMAVASMASYLVFAYIAVETGHTLLENILYVTLVLVFVGMAFKLWRLEGGGNT